MSESGANRASEGREAAFESLACPRMDSPFLQAELRALGADARLSSQALQLRERGYLRVEGLLEPELVDAIVAGYDWLFDPRTEFEATPDELHRLQLDTNRRQDAWSVFAPVRSLACHEGVLDLLRALYGREPIPFQTLNFLQGSAQSLHADAMHFSSVPAGFLCGVWVALEDVSPDSGPLRYAPGSHRASRVQLSDLGRWASKQDHDELGPNYGVYERYVAALLAAGEYELEELVCPKGSVLIWAADLVHGGAPILDPSTTRRSQVTHYYFEDCIYYSPIHSDAALGEYALREVRDIRSGERVPHALNGVALRERDVGYRDCDLMRLMREAQHGDVEAPDLLAKLERERARQQAHLRTLEADNEHQRGHIQNLERILRKTHAHTLYRLGSAVKDLFVKPHKS